MTTMRRRNTRQKAQNGCIAAHTSSIQSAWQGRGEAEGKVDRRQADEPRPPGLHVAGQHVGRMHQARGVGKGWRCRSRGGRGGRFR